MHGSSSTDKWGNDPATNVARKGRLNVLIRPMSAWKPASSGGASTSPFSARSWSPGSNKPLACEESDTDETNNVLAGGALGPQKSSAASPFDLRRSSGMGGGTGAPRSRANERSRLAWRAALREASSCHGAAPSDAVRRWRRGGLSMATRGRSPSYDDGRRRLEESGGGGGGGGGGRVDRTGQLFEILTIFHDIPRYLTMLWLILSIKSAGLGICIHYLQATVQLCTDSREGCLEVLDVGVRARVTSETERADLT